MALYYGEEQSILNESRFMEQITQSSGTVYHFGDRIGNNSTIACQFTDKFGQKYIVAVLDAQYRGSVVCWSNDESQYSMGQQTNTLLTDYGYVGEDGYFHDDDITDGMIESATYNTNTILDNYEASKYPAFNFARSASEVSMNGITYKSQLPNAQELRNIRLKGAILDGLDPTINNYPENAISQQRFVWTSNECYNGETTYTNDCYGVDGNCDIIRSSKVFPDMSEFDPLLNNVVWPIFEIPLGENDSYVE